ncbi:hypothetical protein RM844_10470 [Streptomyces sp. DSM 44915]|uniref:Uncharacterized protein n=1 Tax=Streptomyces chisholmiae TaxID=3075540 RepID=A0ABU2JP08_9ACTN|nr:hypothetical protein [Streptomyces sp. DSM 44915]MDT0266717.1 hypothetical protein [Streptomyces sp. DSM 44915]
MTAVQADWLTLLCAAVVVLTLPLAFGARRSALKRGEPMPGWGNALQGVGLVAVLLMALVNVVWGGA